MAGIEASAEEEKEVVMATTLVQVPTDEQTLRIAERVAALRHTTVADMLSWALETISRFDFDESKLSPTTRKALGLATGVPDQPYKELLVDALMAKYGTEE